MVRTTIYLEQEVHDNLMSLADQRTSFSEHIRRAVDRYLVDMGGFDGTDDLIIHINHGEMGADKLTAGDDAT